MPSLKSFRLRIRSVQSTQKITKAMKMVAAAKLRRAQEQAMAARPYAEAMDKVLAALGQSFKGTGPRLLAGTGSDKVQLVIVATSDRGLCGAFNSSIVREARRVIRAMLADGKTVKILCVGRKARDQLRRGHVSRIVETFEVGGNPSLAVAEEVSAKIQALFEAGDVDVVTLFFSQFKSVVTQTPTVRQLIPAQIEEGAATIDLKGAAYEYEPDEATILADLLPRNITTQIFSAMLENQAGFFAAQMTAMDNATRNAGDMIASLTLQMNRARQAQITKELIEIISGAEAI
jgi:F-type H+-transporting ATPase subunit gamma